MLRSFGFVSVSWSFFIQRAILWLILVLEGFHATDIHSEKRTIAGM